MRALADKKSSDAYFLNSTAVTKLPYKGPLKPIEIDYLEVTKLRVISTILSA